MARYLIREAHGGETRTIRDGALPYFQNQGWVVLETLDDADDASPLYLSKAEGDLRWAKIADLGDPESAEVAVISEAVADSPALRAAFVPAIVLAGAGIDPTGVTNSASAIQAMIATANAAGAGVYVPAGTYRVDAPIEDVRRLYLAEGARIVAGAPGMEAVLRTRIGTRFDRGTITGAGTVDAGTNAAIGIHLRDFLHFTVQGIQVVGGTTAAIKAGQTGSSGRSAEAVLSNLRLIHTAATIPTDCRGILVENSGDHSISQVLIQNYEYGISLPVAGNAIVHDVHAWTEPAKGSLRVGFEDRSNNSHYTACHADTPTEYGWRLYGYQTTLVQCGTYNNPNAANSTDNVAVGVKFESPNTIAALIGHYFLGGDATHRLKADIEAADGNYGLIQMIGCSNQHLGTQRSLTSRAIALTVRDVLAGGTVAANKATPDALTGLSIRATDKERWRLALDGAAEAGSNAGSGLSLKRYADDGTTLLGEVLFIARASGTVVLKSALSIDDGKNITLGSTTGTQIGTAATQKLGFYGLPPVVQPSGTPADATDLATAIALVNNLKGKLLTLGLIRT